MASVNSRAQRRLASASMAALAIAIPAGAIAQTSEAASGPQLEEIIVTAQKREQRLQDVPVAVTALAGEALQANRIMTVRDLNGLVPNLTVRTQAGGSALPIYTMRGLVATGGAAGSDKGIAIYIDGVYFGSSTGSIFDLAEIERLEVLRGPQGTLFGRNSTGGAISFFTPEPTGEFGVKQTLTVGNYDQFRTTTRLNTPQYGPLSAMVSYTHSERRGDIRNLGAGAKWDFTRVNGGKTTILTSPKWLGSHNNEAVSAAVKYDGGDRLKALYRFDYMESDFTSNGFGVTYMQPFVRAVVASQPDQSLMTPVTRSRPKAVNAQDTVPGRTKTWGHALTIDYQIAENARLKNIAAYRKLEYSAPMTELLGLGGLINTGSPAIFALPGVSAAIVSSTVGAPLILRPVTNVGHDSQFSDELQLNVDTSLVTLTTGALYYEMKTTKGGFGEPTGLGTLRGSSFGFFPGFSIPYTAQLAGTGGRDTTIKIRSYAAYAYGEFHVTPQLDLVAGVRYTKDRKKGVDFATWNTLQPVTFPIDYEGDKVTYNLGVNYKVRDDVLVYGKYSTGFISGGALAGIEYAPETAKSWEAGVKADWFGNTLRTNLALFTVKYGQLQQPTSGTALSPPNPLIVQALVNSGDARAKGGELEVTWRPIRALTLSGGVGYTDFKFLSLNPIVTRGTSEYLVQYRPKWTANLAAQYQSEPVWNEAYVTARLDANYKSKTSALGGVTASLSPAEQTLYKAGAIMDPYWLVNARIALQGFTLAGADATVSIWSKNLLNSKEINYPFSGVFAVAADYERARTVGVDLTVEF